MIIIIINTGQRCIVGRRRYTIAISRRLGGGGTGRLHTCCYDHYSRWCCRRRRCYIIIIIIVAIHYGLIVIRQSYTRAFSVRVRVAVVI